MRALLVEGHAMSDGNARGVADIWPYWLEEIYGPRPEGPRIRAEALRKDAERKREIERRLNAEAGGKQ